MTQSTNKIEVYDTLKNEWEHFKTNSVPPLDNNAFTFDSDQAMLYVFGGY